MYKDMFIKDIVANAQKLFGNKVRACGWIHRVRDLGNVKFLVLRDRTGLIQVVAKKGETPEPVFQKASDLREEDVVCAEGILRSAPTKEGCEIAVSDLLVLSTPVEPLPLEVKTSRKASLPTRLRYRWLDLRNLEVQSIFLFKAWVAAKFREYFSKQGFVEIFTPKIVATGTEGGANLFPVIYFGKTVYLAQSPQFYKQMGVIAGFERVFEIGPVYRAEPHNTTRHLNEYHSLDIEVGFIKSYEDVMKFVEGFFAYLTKSILENEEIKKILETHNVEPPRAPPEGFPKIRMRDAYKILEEEFNKRIPYGEDLDSEAEKLLGQYAKEKYNSDFVFIIEYPWRVRPFYTMRKEDEPEWTYSFDLLMRGMEVATGGQREHRYEKLLENLRDKGMRTEDFEFYLEFFKHGVPPHGGAGIGLERIVMQTLGLLNIREARLLPRDLERLTP
ncbi:MAG: aspartate--tRNA(Asn) ligase [Acidilobaceae archaeon]